MAKYAEGTETSPENSRQELDRVLRRYGADEVQISHGKGKGAVMFKIQGKVARLTFTAPAVDTFRWVRHGTGERKRKDQECIKAWEQEERRLWRVLVLRVKSRLEAIAGGDETFEQAFMAYLLLPTGDTVEQALGPRIDAAYRTGRMDHLGLDGLLLPAPAPDGDQEEEEVWDAR